MHLLLVLQHDSGLECTPGESKSQDKKERGNYIMYARATSGDKLNNNKFSSCSISNISAVLQRKRDDCFVGTLFLFFPPLAEPTRSSLHGIAPVCLQSPDNLFAVMGWWKPKRSATVATATSAKIHAAIVPMKQRAKGANCNLVKSAGPSCLFVKYSPLKCWCQSGLKPLVSDL